MAFAKVRLSELDCLFGMREGVVEVTQRDLCLSKLSERPDERTVVARVRDHVAGRRRLRVERHLVTGVLVRRPDDLR